MRGPNLTLSSSRETRGRVDVSMDGDDLIRNLVGASEPPSTVRRNLVRRDGTQAAVELPGAPGDQPDPYIRLVADNHWYKWDQEAGTYRWFSTTDPPEVTDKEIKEVRTALTYVLAGFGVIVLFALVGLILLIWG